jgi:PAS domain S-box-containing protein
MELMAWQWTPYTILPLTAVATLIIAALYILRRRRYRPGAEAGAVLLFACAGLMVAYVLEIVSADLPTKILWNKVQYVGLVTAPMASLVFSLQYTGHEEWLTRRNLVLLSIVPLITLLLVFTNETHGLIWRHVRLDTNGPLSELDKTFGIGFWGMLAYVYVLMLAAIFLHIQMLIQSRRLYRWQASLLMFATLIAYLGATLDAFKVSPLPRLVSTSLGIAVGGLTVAFAIFRVRRGDLLSVSHGAVIRSMGDAVVVLDAYNHIVDLNPAARHVIGHGASKAIGQSVKQIWPDLAGQLERSRDMAEAGKELALGKGDGQRTYDVSISPLADWRGHLISQVVVLRDITERKRAEEQIKASLREKEVLLQEIHHRVKNNLQVISSLLYLQSKNIQDRKTLEMFQESQSRVRSMALVHERLYQSQDLARVDFAEYVRGLANYLFRSYGVNTNVIRLKINSDDVFLGVDTAIPCGLIINELVSNSLKYAFPDGREGEIHIELRVDDGGQFTLMISDNGVGFPKDLDFRDTGSLGLQLVNTLVGQLEGTIELDRSSGTALRIAFAELKSRKG